LPPKTPKLIHIQGREPAADVLRKPHEGGNGFLLPPDERIAHLRTALAAIQKQAVDLEHARIIAHSALRLDAGGATAPEFHLRTSFIERNDGPSSARLRRFLALVSTPAPTAVSEVVRQHVYAMKYEGVIGKEALEALPDAVKKAEKTPSRELLQKYVRKWKRSVILDGDLLAKICDALITELSLDRSSWTEGDWCDYLETRATLAQADENFPRALRAMADEVSRGEHGVPDEYRDEVVEYLTLASRRK
jgi:hypothetical protein